jgi:hypothetical protein
MQLTLNTHEIKQAIENYVNTQGVSTDNKSVEISLLAKRGQGGGVEATVYINDQTANTPTIKPTNSIEEVEVEESTQKTEATSKSIFGNDDDD